MEECGKGQNLFSFLKENEKQKWLDSQLCLRVIKSNHNGQKRAESSRCIKQITMSPLVTHLKITKSRAYEYMHAYELSIENIKLTEVFHGNSENISVFVFSWLLKNPSIS